MMHVAMAERDQTQKPDQTTDVIRIKTMRTTDLTSDMPYIPYTYIIY